MHVQTDEERQHSAGVHLRDSSHPVWEEFFRTGKYCLAGVLDAKGARVRELNGTDTPWYDWNSGQVANPRVPALLRHLHDSGVTGTLSVPTFIAGRVTGFLSIRFRGKQDFKCEEIELARALAHQAMLALQLMRLSRESHRMAVIEERHRMARELHDALAQGITGVIIQLEAAEDAASRHLSEEVDQHLKRARELARGSLRDARRTVHAMRPSALKNRDLCGALAALFKDMTEPAGMRTSFVQRGHPVKLGPKVEENLLRITQEVLTNAIRHAQAAHFSGRLAFGKRQVRLLLLDNGRGFDPSISHDGFGLTGIRERVEGMGGRLCLRTAPGRGTAILIRLPGPGETFRSLIQA
jgi:signal transduction histidine kinase